MYCVTDALVASHVITAPPQPAKAQDSILHNSAGDQATMEQPDLENIPAALVDHLIEEIAVTGSWGRATTELRASVDAILRGHSDVFDSIYIDSVLDKVAFHADVELKPAKEEDVSEGKYGDQRFFASEKLAWNSLCGHDKNHKLVAPLCYHLLGIIGSKGREGIIQPKLVRASGQQKQSVPRRTDQLAERGYITKKTVLADKSKTSLLTLAKFASTDDAQETPFVNYDAWFDESMRLLKAQPDWIIAMLDLRVGLNLHLNRYETRALMRCIRRLCNAGVLRKCRVTATDGDGQLIRCIQLLKEPSEEDKMLWKSKPRPPRASAPKTTLEQALGDFTDPELTEGDEYWPITPRKRKKSPSRKARKPIKSHKKKEAPPVPDGEQVEKTPPPPKPPRELATAKQDRKNFSAWAKRTAQQIVEDECQQNEDELGEDAVADRVAQVEEELLSKSRPGIYINPPGAREAHYWSAARGRGRPRLALIAVFKSDTLKEYLQEVYVPPPEPSEPQSKKKRKRVNHDDDNRQENPDGQDGQDGQDDQDESSRPRRRRRIAQPINYQELVPSASETGSVDDYAPTRTETVIAETPDVVLPYATPHIPEDIGIQTIEDDTSKATGDASVNAEGAPAKTEDAPPHAADGATARTEEYATIQTAEDVTMRTAEHATVQTAGDVTTQATDATPQTTEDATIRSTEETPHRPGLSRAERGRRVREYWLKQRYSVILDIITQCNGVFSGKQELFRPFCTAWKKAHGQTPDRRTFGDALKNLLEADKLKSITFAFQGPMGTNELHTMFALPDIAADSPEVLQLQNAIKESFPEPYLPPNLTTTEEQPFEAPVEPRRIGSYKQDFPVLANLTVQRTAEAQQLAGTATRILPRKPKPPGEQIADDESSRPKRKRRGRPRKNKAAQDNDEKDVVQNDDEGEVILPYNEPRSLVVDRQLYHYNEPSNNPDYSPIRPADDALFPDLSQGEYHPFFRNGEEAHPPLEVLNDEGLRELGPGNPGLLIDPALEAPDNLEEAMPPDASSHVTPPAQVPVLDAAPETLAENDKSTLYGKDYTMAHPTEEFYHVGGGRYRRGKAPEGYRQRRLHRGLPPTSNLGPTFDKDHVRAHPECNFKHVGHGRYRLIEREDNLQAPPQAVFPPSLAATSAVPREGVSATLEQLSGPDHEDLFCAVAIVRLLFGGHNQNHYDWDLIRQTLGDQHSKDSLKLRWLAVRGVIIPEFEAAVTTLMKQMLEASRKREVPFVNFDSPQDTDWPLLLQWTKHTVLLAEETRAKMETTAPKDRIYAKLPATTEEFHSRFSTSPHASAIRADHEVFHSKAVDMRRAQTALTLLHSVPMPKRPQPDEHSPLLLSYCRAICVTKTESPPLSATCKKSRSSITIKKADTSPDETIHSTNPSKQI
ncbi:hypothetical protein K470DRAFT_85576 [Piedraia hortae CBS 480.64]|uniref:Uncharacterized protein n=1 Tax=Piedraia hortae CBS 480.64 TaxID=1314780 RepID=A0A6A7BXK9_9PEZI|nr:hypothetical protein K470DRAFT_85576 [Piedraia hortae CBS 480.64]